MTDISGLSESYVTFSSSQGLELRAALLFFDSNSIKFELCTPEAVLRTSEILKGVSVSNHGRVVFQGSAVTTELLGLGSNTIATAMLDQKWVDPANVADLTQPSHWRTGFENFFRQWQALCKISVDYKAVISDLQFLLMDLKLWLQEAQSAFEACPSDQKSEIEKQAAKELAGPTLQLLTRYFEQFEHLAAGLDAGLVPAHRAYTKRQLHPHLLCSPFLYRTYQKPLGYAGDYEMVNMIVRNPLEGASLYAKLINLWFLSQPPAQAHRNRIEFLVDRISGEWAGRASTGRPVRVLSVGCGPAAEVQQVLEQMPPNLLEFTLLDFNEETLNYTRRVIEEIKRRRGRSNPINYVKKSVNQILKAEGKPMEGPAGGYDLVYCAGLFDYLTDQVCHRLMSVLYDWTAAGGLLIATNVHTCNPRQITMDYVMDWSLIYRDSGQMTGMRPKQCHPDLFHLSTDETGVNAYVEARKAE